jgi:2-isopropylmalate synthase
VTIRIRHEDRVFSGHAANTDIVVASAYAYLHALNRLYAALQLGKALHPQRDSAPVTA